MPTLSPTTSETLRHPRFRRFFTGITIANVGQFLQGLAVPFLVNELTDSNAWVGAASFASLLPAVLATPFAGILSDRLDRKKLLVGAYLCQIIVTAVLVAMFYADALTPWRILVLQVLGGAAGGFQWAPLQSMSGVLVPQRLLADAARLVSISFTAGRAVGPALAAVILATAGPGPAFGGTLAFYVVAVGFLATVETEWQPGAQREPFRQQFAEGLAYISVRPAMRLAMAAQAMVAFFGGVFTFALTASVADDAFNVGGGGLGALAMFAGVGSVLASIYITTKGATVARSRVEAAALVLYPVGILVAASTPHIAVGIAGFTLMGAAHMLTAVTLSTALQVQVDEAFRGRVMSVWLMFTMASLPLGALVGGALADVIDIRIVMAGFASVLLTFALVRARVGDGFGPLDDELPATERLPSSQ